MKPINTSGLSNQAATLAQPTWIEFFQYKYYFSETTSL